MSAFGPVIIPPGLKWTGCASHHSASSNAQDKNEWRYNSLPPLHPFMAGTKMSSHLEDDSRGGGMISCPLTNSKLLPYIFS